MIKNREQVVVQCKVVAHLATELAEVHRDLAQAFGSKAADSIVDQVGESTARLMETLGNVLNGMDAVTEDDAWTEPVFEEAQRLWPSK